MPLTSGLDFHIDLFFCFLIYLMRHFTELTGRYVLALALLFLRDTIMGGFSVLRFLWDTDSAPYILVLFVIL